MMYKLQFTGVCLLDAENEEEARQLFEEGDYYLKEEQIEIICEVYRDV